MIDHTMFQVENHGKIDFKNNDPFEYNKLIFVPQYNKTDAQFRFFDARLKNLVVRYIPSHDRIYIYNSLHKFYNGNNYSDFSFSDLKAALWQLMEALEMDLQDAKIKKIEYGCNLDVTGLINPLNNLKSYRGKDYGAMNNKGKDYGKRCEFSQYTIKAYNKSLQAHMVDNVNLTQDLFRWEIKVNRMDALLKRKPPIAIETGRDLFNQERLFDLSNDLVEKYKQSVKAVTPDFRALSIREKTAYARMSVPAIKEDLKINHQDTLKQDMRIYKKILACIKNNDADKIENLLVEKLEQLLNT